MTLTREGECSLFWRGEVDDVHFARVFVVGGMVKPPRTVHSSMGCVWPQTVNTERIGGRAGDADELDKQGILRRLLHRTYAKRGN